MRMKPSITAIAVGFALTFAGSATDAAPINFLLLNDSAIAIDIATQTLGQSSGAAGATGSVDVDWTAGNLTVTGSSIHVGDIATTGSGLLGSLLISDVHAVLTSTSPATNPGGHVLGVYDLAGWTLTLDQGTVYIPALDLTPFDFSTGPLELALPTVLSTLYFAGWSVPVSAVVTFFTLGNTITVTASGLLHFGIPEPSTLVLLGAGLAGLVITRRRPG